MASKLEELGKQFRTDNIIKNTYQNGEGNEYGAKHPNAKADGDNKGKGTGKRYKVKVKGKGKVMLKSDEEEGVVCDHQVQL